MKENQVQSERTPRQYCEPGRLVGKPIHGGALDCGFAAEEHHRDDCQHDAHRGRLARSLPQRDADRHRYSGVGHAR